MKAQCLRPESSHGFSSLPRTCQWRVAASLVLVLAAVAHAAGSDLAAEKPKANGVALPVLLHEDFEAGASRWEPSDPSAWKTIAVDGGHAYSLVKQSKYKPPHRSPLNFALVRDMAVGDFTLEARVRSTVKDYAHRDVCLFFGWQDSDHFYYVHLGKKTDDHANQIFIVNGADRKKISTKTTPGTDWDDAWHRVKIVRNAADGAIAVYFDNMDAPVMTAADKTFATGRVGLGSFDDLADFDDVTLRGIKASK
jgi:hypothetical protein